MKILVFGSTGMLGRYVSTYFENMDKNITRLTRKDYDISKINYKELQNFLSKYNLESGDIIINCAGIINQRGHVPDKTYYNVNSYFPIYLGDMFYNSGVRVIHASTDCVYDGAVGNYTEEDVPNATDIYGFTKAMGESRNLSTIIRTSIVGEELQNQVSFFEFVRQNNGKSINGYTNQIWNGITCLQWAKSAYKIIENNLPEYRGILHLFSPEKVNKYELASKMKTAYSLNLEIYPISSPNKHDKTLSTIHSNSWMSQFDIPSIDKQLQEMKNFELR